MRSKRRQHNLLWNIQKVDQTHWIKAKAHSVRCRAALVNLVTNTALVLKRSTLCSETHHRLLHICLASFWMFQSRIVRVIRRFGSSRAKEVASKLPARFAMPWYCCRNKFRPDNQMVMLSFIRFYFTQIGVAFETLLALVVFVLKKALSSINVDIHSYEFLYCGR